METIPYIPLLQYHIFSYGLVTDNKKKIEFHEENRYHKSNMKKKKLIIYLQVCYQNLKTKHAKEE